MGGWGIKRRIIPCRKLQPGRIYFFYVQTCVDMSPVCWTRSGQRLLAMVAVGLRRRYRTLLAAEQCWRARDDGSSA